MKKSIITILSVLSVLFVFAGCSPKNVDEVTSKTESMAEDAKDKMESAITGSENSSHNSSGNTSTNSEAKAAKISEDEAKAAAFKHADIKEADAYDFKAELETDDGVLSYEISFETKSAEYSYHINADTGEVISSAKEEKNQSSSR